MDYAFLWYRDRDDSPITKALGRTEGMVLPYLVVAPPRGVGSYGPVNVRTLACGILALADTIPAYGVDAVPTPEERLVVLGVCARMLGYADADEVAVQAACAMRRAFPADMVRDTLRYAARLIPESVMARGDLVVELFFAGCQDEAQGVRTFSECADEFHRWRGFDTSRCTNESAVWYCGIAAHAWLGRSEERDRLLAGIPDRVRNATGWSSRYDRLQGARERDTATIRLEPA